MEHFEIQIVALTKYGEFAGKKVIMDEERYLGLCEIAKNFYTSGGFELTLENGGFVVIPPELVSQSILRIIKTKLEDQLPNNS